MSDRNIVIFDGICNFCNGAVDFIIKRDPGGKFLFTPMQSDLGRSLIIEHGIDAIDGDTIVLIKDGKSFIWSSAILEITKDLKSLWKYLAILGFVPSPIRDTLYKVFARNRYRFFGQKSECMVPTEDVRQRFIGM